MIDLYFVILSNSRPNFNAMNETIIDKTEFLDFFHQSCAFNKHLNSCFPTIFLWLLPRPGFLRQPLGSKEADSARTILLDRS